MAALQTFRFYDQLGNGLTGLSPTFRAYLNSAGSPVAGPAIFPLGLGKYGFIYDDAAAVRVYQVDGGATAFPRYLVGGNNGDVQAFGTYTLQGAPAAPGVGSPNFLQYVDQAAVSQAQPTILNPMLGLYFFIPSGPDISGGRSFVIRSDSNGVLQPKEYEGTVGNVGGGGGGGSPPVVLNLDPALATSVSNQQPISFELQVAGLGTTFQRVVILVSFPNQGLYEVAHDGDAFSQPYPAELGNSRVDLSSGAESHFKFTLLRREGWPVSPRIIPLGIDDLGGVSNITANIYAWTLV